MTLCLEDRPVARALLTGERGLPISSVSRGIAGLAAPGDATWVADELGAWASTGDAYELVHDLPAVLYRDNHVLPYLDVDLKTIRHGFELTLYCEIYFMIRGLQVQNGRTNPAYTRRVQKDPVR